MGRAGWKDGFGRAVSRILSASKYRGRESFVSAASTRDPFAFAKPERAAPGSPIWPCTRWGFPCLVACASSGGLLPHLFTLTNCSGGLRPSPLPSLAERRYNFGGLIFCGPVRRDASRHHLPRVSQPHTSLSYAASCPVEFGLSSPPSEISNLKFEISEGEAILRPSKTARTLAEKLPPDKTGCNPDWPV